MLEWLESLLSIFSGPLGVLSIFLISLISNSIPFVSIPYLAVILAYSIIVQDLTMKLFIAFASALGATIGKIIIYAIGSLVRMGLSEKTLKNLEVFNRIASKSLFLAIFLFASLPLPDDILYIPIGITKYSMIKYSVAVLLGKTVLTSAIIFYSHIVKEQVTEFAYLIPAYLILTIIISYIIIKVDWAAVLDALTTKGITESINELVKQIITIFKSK
ncbi:MAG: hypothetical protein QXD94_05990 [Sulfolobales archaeon]